MKSRFALACVVMLMGVLLVSGVALAKNFTGTFRDDQISGTKRADTIKGREGNDRLSGRSGPDEIIGGEDHDRIRGGNGNDILRAADGERDHIRCGNGFDRVYADPDRDSELNTLDVVYFGCERVIVSR